jgi:hypothetical protein
MQFVQMGFISYFRNMLSGLLLISIGICLRGQPDERRLGGASILPDSSSSNAPSDVSKQPNVVDGWNSALLPATDLAQTLASGSRVRE